MIQTTLQGRGTLIVLKNVGHLLRYMAALPLLLLPVAWIYREGKVVIPVLLTSALFLGAGEVLARLPAPREPRLREGLLIAAVGWLVVPLGSVLPFTLIEGWSLLDAYFEAMSAWTGTGHTMADVTALTRTTLFWRSVMQWVGGLGVIVLTLAVLARPGTGAFTLYVSEAREEKLKPSVVSTTRTLWRLYGVLTVLGVLFLLFAGLPPWDAVNHGLTAIATGGMSIHPGSIGDYTAPGAQWAFVPIMILGALPFVAIYALARNRWRAFLLDEQVRALFFLLILAAPLVFLALGRTLATEPLDALRLAGFQVVSAVTSTGFQTADIASWTPSLKVGLAGLMLLGGAAGSTAGGIKLVRGILLLRGTWWKLNRSGLPHFSVTTFRFGGERLDEREANEEFAEASFILVLWVTLLFLGALVLLVLLPAESPLDVLFDLASTQSNVGLSTGVVSPEMPTAAKGVLVAVMWAGRLEILPALLVLRGLLPRLRG